MVKVVWYGCARICSQKCIRVISGMSEKSKTFLSGLSACIFNLTSIYGLANVHSLGAIRWENCGLAIGFWLVVCIGCKALDVCSVVVIFKTPETCAENVRFRRHAVIVDAPSKWRRRRQRQRQGQNEKLHTDVFAPQLTIQSPVFLYVCSVVGRNWFSIVKNASATRVNKNTTITLIESASASAVTMKLPFKCTQ